MNTSVKLTLEFGLFGRSFTVNGEENWKERESKIDETNMI